MDYIFKNVIKYRRAFSLVFFLIFFGICIELLKPWPLKFVIDYLTSGKLGRKSLGLALPANITESVTTFLIFIASVILILAILDALVSYYTTYLQRKTGTEIITRLRSRLFSHVQRLSLQFHYKRRTGEMVKRITHDTEYLEAVFSESLASLLKGSLQILGMAIIMFWMDWQMMLVALILTPLLLWIMLIFTREIRKASRVQRHREGNLAAIAQETFSSIEIVKTYNRERFVDELFDQESVANYQAALNATNVEAKFMPVVQVVTAFGVVVVVCFGVLRVQAGVLTAGDLWVFLSYLKAFYKPLKDFSRQLRRLMRGQVRWEKIEELLNEPPCSGEPGTIRAPELRGNIEFDHVHFAYADGLPVLKGICLKIHAGEKVALVGPTGSGKSTLVSLLAKLYVPQAGRILVDDQDLRDFTADSVREQMSFVLQETLLFRTTIRENIAYGRLDASFGEIVQAAKMARIHDFILSLPDGYETIVGERGVTLSGGQRQRISIARAILRNAQIIILDEPTTGLDLITAREVWKALTILTRNKTTILISHQPQLALEMDTIYHLEKGEIVEIRNSNFSFAQQAI
ncbi:MAG: ABC transporter ATP-binding protein [Calditrichaeota bacterium]|nr:MAG: ABC transporter ATP-binding protein [Calditrichota bacterium]